MNEILLRKELYSLATISRASEDYKNLAQISIEDTDEYYKTVFHKCKYNEQLTMDEFENYLIDLTVKK